MKKLLRTTILGLMLVSAQAFANPIDSVTNHFSGFSGEYFLSGTVYTAPADVTNHVTGIGRINSIQDASNNILWSSGMYGSWINFVFSNFLITSLSDPAGIFHSQDYTEANGSVSFFDASSNIFSATGNWLTDSTNIINNSDIAFATLSGANQTVDGTTYSTWGKLSPHAFDAHGGLNITGGSHGNYFNTNSMMWGSIFTDMTIDFTGSDVNTLGYRYSGVANAKGLMITPTTVPEPMPVLLLGIGLIILAFASRRRTDKVACTAMA